MSSEQDLERLRRDLKDARKSAELPPPDMVNKPPHYRSSLATVECINCGERTTVECIDVTRHMNFNVGNVIKYCWRLGLKGDPVEQLRKAVFYLQDEIKRLGGAS